MTRRCCRLRPFFFHFGAAGFSSPDGSSSSSVSSAHAPGGGGGSPVSGLLSTGAVVTFDFGFGFGFSFDLVAAPTGSVGGGPIISPSISRIASSSSPCASSSIFRSSATIVLSPRTGGRSGWGTGGLSRSVAERNFLLRRKNDGVDSTSFGVCFVGVSPPERSPTLRFRGVEKRSAAGEAETRSSPRLLPVPGVPRRTRRCVGVVSTSTKDSNMPRTLPISCGVGPTVSRGRLPKRRRPRVESGDS